MQSQVINRDDVLADFASTLNALPGMVVEISRAQPGGSIFSTASYHDSVTPKQLDEIVQTKCNVGFLPGVDLEALNQVRKNRKNKNGEPEPLEEIILGEFTTRNTRNEVVTQRNIISLEIDFKDVHGPSFLNLSPSEKKAIIEQSFWKHHPSIKGSFGDIWIACFSGNSLHLHLRLKNPLDCTDHHRYAHNYDFLVDKFESEIFQGEVKFDRQCKNTARLMRIPYSTNLKIAESPIQTGPIYFNPNADVTHAINILWDLADTHQEKTEQSAKALSASPEASDHKSQLKQVLTFRKVLEHFRYKKFNSLRDLRNGETQCSSPWKEDRNPSCFLNEGKKQFKDFSSDRSGDIFNFIAEMGNLDIRTQFPSVIAVAESITGIKKVINMKPHLAVDNSTDKQPSRAKATFKDYCSFFDDHLPEATRDILSGRLLFKLDSEWTSALNRLNILKSHALETDHIKRTHIEDHLHRFVETKPKKLLVDIPQWDGVDRVKKIASCVHMKNVSQQVFEELMKEWGSKIFMRLQNKKVQNNLIIFKGPQGIGKDYLADAFVEGLGRYYTDIHITENERDNYTTIANYLVGRINEFDRTSKIAAATIKALVTAEKASFIQKYAVDPTEYNLRCSLIATCNVNEILRDHTGNRRYSIFDITHIDRSYPDKESPQILAQFKQLADENYEPNKELVRQMEIYIGNHTPDDPSEGILEIWDSRLEEFERNGSHGKNGKFRIADVQYILADISKTYRTSMKELNTLLQTNGRKKRDKITVYYCKGSSEQLKDQL